MASTIPITKHKGELMQRERIFKSIEAMFQTVRNGEYTLTLKRNVSQRSVNQNAMMWMWFNCLAMETGSTKDDFHDYYCDKFLSRRALIDGREVRISSGTSKLDTVAMTQFLNQVQADAAAEFGVTLPTPEDLYWEEFENHYKRFY